MRAYMKGIVMEKFNNIKPFNPVIPEMLQARQMHLLKVNTYRGVLIIL